MVKYKFSICGKRQPIVSSLVEVLDAIEGQLLVDVSKLFTQLEDNVPVLALVGDKYAEVIVCKFTDRTILNNLELLEERISSNKGYTLICQDYMCRVTLTKLPHYLHLVKYLRKYSVSVSDEELRRIFTQLHLRIETTFKVQNDTITIQPL